MQIFEVQHRVALGETDPGEPASKLCFETGRVLSTQKLSLADPRGFLRRKFMGKIADLTLTGASGTKYVFVVYSADTEFRPAAAVYDFTKRSTKDGTATHQSLYVGQTDSLQDRIPNHEKWPCVRKHGCNCICVHLESNEKRRLAIEADLIKALRPPCNDQ